MASWEATLKRRITKVELQIVDGDPLKVMVTFWTAIGELDAKEMSLQDVQAIKQLLEPYLTGS